MWHFRHTRYTVLLSFFNIMWHFSSHFVFWVRFCEIFSSHNPYTISALLNSSFANFSVFGTVVSLVLFPLFSCVSICVCLVAWCPLPPVFWSPWLIVPPCVTFVSRFHFRSGSTWCFSSGVLAVFPVFGVFGVGLVLGCCFVAVPCFLASCLSCPGVLVLLFVFWSVGCVVVWLLLVRVCLVVVVFLVLCCVALFRFLLVVGFLFLVLLVVLWFVLQLVGLWLLVSLVWFFCSWLFWFWCSAPGVVWLVWCFGSCGFGVAGLFCSSWFFARCLVGVCRFWCFLLVGSAHDQAHVVLSGIRKERSSSAPCCPQIAPMLVLSGSLAMLRWLLGWASCRRLRIQLFFWLVCSRLLVQLRLLLSMLFLGCCLRSVVSLLLLLLCSSVLFLFVVFLFVLLWLLRFSCWLFFLWFCPFFRLVRF